MFNALKKDKLKVVPIILILTILSMSMWNWYDISIFENWVRVSKYTGLYKIYEVPLSLGNISYRVVYPPIPPLIYIGTHWLVDAFIGVVNSISSSMPSVGQALLVATDHIVRGVIKLPLLVFTVALAILLWRKFGSEAFYWVVIGVPTLVTLANYQFDPLVAFFLYLAIIGLELPRVGIYVSSLSTALVVLTKPLAAISLIPLIYYIYRKTNIRGLIQYITIASVVVLMLVLPFFLANPYAFIYNVILFHSSRAPQYVSLWNIFVLLSGRNPEVIKLINVVWLPVMLIAIVGTFLLLKKKIRMENKDDVVLATLVLLSLVLVLNKVVNPNYLLWAYPLIVHLAFSYRLKLRSTLLTFNVAAALATLWGGLYMLIPALVNDVVVIEETGELLPARTYIYKSLDTPLNETVQNLISLGEKYYSYVKLIESYTNVIGAGLILAYSLVMLILVRRLINVCLKGPNV
ncbi:MAG: hypothetical protein QW130_04995 [Sulfolobales archaeon]